MFALLDAMKWAHLPVVGGLYDQDPALMDQFRFIFAERAKEAERERRKSEREANQQKLRRGSARSR